MLGRGQLPRPEVEHVVREYPELAIIDRALFDRVQARINSRVDKSSTHRGRPPGAGTRPYVVSGLLKCGEGGGSMSVGGQKVKNGVRYAQFACSAHRSRGHSICSNPTTIGEKKITAAILTEMRELLPSPRSWTPS
jgi:hypothetical protein